MSKHPYLRRMRQTWFFRLRVPSDLVAVVGKKEIVESLKTSDVGVARQKGAERFADVNAMFLRLRSGETDLSAVEIERQARRVYDDTLDDIQRAEAAGQFMSSDPEFVGGRNAHEAGLNASIDNEAEAIGDGGDVGLMGPQLAIVAQRLGKLPDVRSPSYEGLVLALHRARLTAAQTRLAALEGRTLEPPAAFNPAALDVRGKPRGRISPLPANGTRFADKAAAYIKEVQHDPNAKLTEQTRGQYESVYRLFDQWAGAPTLEDVDHGRAKAFLDAIATLDPLWGRSPATKKRTFAEIMAKYGNHATGLSNRTINRYSVALSLVWQWAKTDVNPWAGQQRKKPEGRKVEKFPFTADELKKLLDRRPAIKPGKRDTATTLPWLCRDCPEPC